MQTKTTFCRICEALCGLEVDVEGDRIVEVRPDPAHVATGGFACLKGLKQHHLYASPDRLRAPEKRTRDGHAPIHWDDALREIGDEVRRIRRAYGPDSIAMYVGTAAGFSVLHPVFAQGFMTGIGSRSMFASATQDCSNKFAVSRLVYGFPFTLPFPDVRRTQCLVVVGANPVVSKWSFLQVPNATQHLRAIEARGGKVWVVDPRRTETAKAAGEHVFIRPGTDVFFYLAFLHEVLARRAVKTEVVARYLRGLEELSALAAPWTPERTAEVTRVPPETLRRIVSDFLAADGAALYCSTGVNMGSRGALAYWIQETIHAITGNLDRAGGTLVGQGVMDFPAFGKKSGALMRSDRSRVGGFGAVNDAFPGGILADEILTPGKGQIRALFVTGGNPLLTMPNAGRLREAFGKLELLVTVDIYRNETGSLAHYVLPATSPFERADLPFIFPLMLGLQAKPYLQATRPVVRPDGAQRDEASIYLALCRAAGVDLFGSSIAQLALESMVGLRGAFQGDGEQPGLPQEALLSLLLRLTGQGSFDALLAHPHGKLRPDHEPGSFLGARVLTDDGKVDLAPAALLEQAARLEAAWEEERREARRLKLITKRQVITHNSWTHNHDEMIKHERTNHVYLHPEDAARLGLPEGAIADVSTDTATVRVPVRHLADLMPGTVALPHGWGHQHATGLSVASKTAGVNVNLLAADGPDRIEPLSGMAHLTGFVVDVRPAAGPRDTASWSGIAESERRAVP